MTPSDRGRLEVYLDGEKVFDRKETGFPDLGKVNELKMAIAENCSIWKMRNRKTPGRLGPDSRRG